MTVSSDSGDNLKVKALDGFLLIGYTGAASDYVKDCDVKISFKAMNVNWKAVMLWGILAVVLVAVLLIAIRLIRRNMMTAEEKKALQEAEAEHKIPLSQRGKQDEAAEEKPVTAAFWTMTTRTRRKKWQTMSRPFHTASCTISVTPICRQQRTKRKTRKTRNRETPIM